MVGENKGKGLKCWLVFRKVSKDRVIREKLGTWQNSVM